MQDIPALRADTVAISLCASRRATLDVAGYGCDPSSLAERYDALGMTEDRSSQSPYDDVANLSPILSAHTAPSGIVEYCGGESTAKYRKWFVELFTRYIESPYVETDAVRAACGCACSTLHLANGRTVIATCGLSCSYPRVCAVQACKPYLA